MTDRKEHFAGKIKGHRRAVVVRLNEYIKQSRSQSGLKITRAMIAEVSEYSLSYINERFAAGKYIMNDDLLVDMLVAVEYITGKNIDHILEG